MEEDETVLTVICKERDGEHVRSVQRMRKTVRTMMDLQVNLSRVPNFLDKDNSLIALFKDTTEIYLVDDVGVLGAFNILPEATCHVHMTFWDQRLRGREQLVAETADYVAKRHQLKSLWTAIPQDARVVRAFVKRAGFTEGGGGISFHYKGVD